MRKVVKKAEKKVYAIRYECPCGYTFTEASAECAPIEIKRLVCRCYNQVVMKHKFLYDK